CFMSSSTCLNIAIDRGYLDITVHLFAIHVLGRAHYYYLSLHDALPISMRLVATQICPWWWKEPKTAEPAARPPRRFSTTGVRPRSEEHTSELQSRFDLVCRLLLEKKKKMNK